MPVSAAPAIRPAQIGSWAVTQRRWAKEWPMWGPAECSVVSWDSPRQRLKVADSWGLVKTFPVAEVWRRPERSPVTSAGTRGMGWIIAASGTVGALIGGTLMALLLR